MLPRPPPVIAKTMLAVSGQMNLNLSRHARHRGTVDAGPGRHESFCSYESHVLAAVEG
jgi:hypothetical protein